MGRTGLRGIWRSVWQDLMKGWSKGGDQKDHQVSACMAEMVVPLIRTGSPEEAHMRMKTMSLVLALLNSCGEKFGCHNPTDVVCILALH